MSFFPLLSILAIASYSSPFAFYKFAFYSFLNKIAFFEFSESERRISIEYVVNNNFFSA